MTISTIHLKFVSLDKGLQAIRFGDNKSTTLAPGDPSDEGEEMDEEDPDDDMDDDDPDDPDESDPRSPEEIPDQRPPFTDPWPPREMQI
ncbi:MAG: hypothetical protein CFE32_15175 [Alphaproteobacteria bacterium PA3]|nr:MAG: hypothetical protein CFE32_15175 [Alphaproteobacteria bacterium PA3]